MRQGPTPTGVPVHARDLRLPRQMFHVLPETPCPYVPGQRERKVLTEIDGADPDAAYSLLSRAGFRRSHQFAYRPACVGCSACVPVRVAADDFVSTQSLRRVWRANADVVSRERAAHATPEDFELFVRYIGTRHDDGEMAGMTFADYRGMVEESRVDTRISEFRDGDGRLLAACLVDWLSDGPSAVYSFFEPTLSHRSLGTYMVLWLIAAARDRGLPYVYLGYWIADSPKMAYKARFRPLEGLGPDGWRVLPA